MRFTAMSTCRLAKSSPVWRSAGGGRGEATARRSGGRGKVHVGFVKSSRTHPTVRPGAAAAGEKSYKYSLAEHHCEPSEEQPCARSYPSRTRALIPTRAICDKH